MSIKIPLNTHWSFIKDFNPSHITCDWKTISSEQVQVPHTVATLSQNYFSEQDYQTNCVYKKNFMIDESHQGQLIYITFEGAGHHATVYLNGQEIGQHVGGYTGFTLDMTPAIKYDDLNTLMVVLNTYENQNIPPFGHVIDYLTYGGLYREVYIEILSNSHIEDVFFATKAVKDTSAEVEIQTKLELKHEASHYTLKYEIYDQEHVVYKASTVLDDTRNHRSFTLEGLDLWTLDCPKLYTLAVTLFYKDQGVDFKKISIGFREAVFKADGFYLNGQKTLLRGMNRHQSYPYVGYAMPKRPQQLDADICKFELGLNAVRTSHYPQSQHFINRCDEIGLLVFTEMPGWQHIGDQTWQDIAVDTVKEMVLQNRNHPSIILWGVRINESLDHDAFYKRTHEVAKSLDPYRATSGVRYIKNSHLIEDVYAFNDFSHMGKNSGALRKKQVTKEKSKAYLVSEFNGHMYPTKSYDTESHRMEHALRHVRVLDAIQSDENIAGSFAWCMFDYNTHQDFGSGDGICHHGVLDMFRNPKLAAAFYKSQSDHETVLEVSSEMNIGDHPGGFIDDFYVYSNADRINLYKNDKFVKTFLPSKAFKNLKHPPFLIDDLVGDALMQGEGYSKKNSDMIKKLLKAGAKYGADFMPFKNKLQALKLILFSSFRPSQGYGLFGKYIGNWGDQSTSYRFEAIKNNRIVKTLSKGASCNIDVEVHCDTDVLFDTETYDVATIGLRSIDQNGNTRHYFNAPVTIRIEGPLSVIGPSTFSLHGGMGGSYVKTIGKSGIAKVWLNVHHPDVKEKLLTFTITNSEEVSIESY